MFKAGVGGNLPQPTLLYGILFLSPVVVLPTKKLSLCLRFCFVSYFPDDKHHQRHRPDSAAVLSSCSPTYYLMDGKAVFPCPDGWFGSQPKQPCEKCSDSCHTCSLTKTNCTSCKPHMYLDNVGVCHNNCPASLVPVSRQERTRQRIRLAGGRSLSKGRLEVYHGNRWGTVCNNSFAMAAAHVACRELGFTSAKAITSQRYPIDPKQEHRIWLDGVSCRGTESSLLACKHSPWNENECYYGQDVEIECSGPNQQNFCVPKDECLAGFFFNRVANNCSACHRTCLTCYSERTCTSCEYSLFLNDESRCIHDCGPHRHGNTRGVCEDCDQNCNSCANYDRKDTCTSCAKRKFLIGSTCNDTCPTDYKYVPLTRTRLGVSGKPLYGQVEVLINGEWGSVCNYGFDRKDAQVVCRSLNLGRAILSWPWSSYYIYRYFPFFKPPPSLSNTLLSDLRCNGSETDLQQCQRGDTIKSCKYWSNVWVSCSGPYLPTAPEQCTKSCPANYYPRRGDNVCHRCASPCWNCSEHAQKCTSCPPQRYLLGTNCVTDCGDGYHGNTETGSCMECASQCKTCLSGPRNDTCNTCRRNLHLSGTMCLPKCESPLFSINGRCVGVCPEGTYHEHSNATCISCSSDCLACRKNRRGAIVCTKCKLPLLANEAGLCISRMLCELQRNLVEPDINAISGRVRLAGGTENAGRVEVFYKGRWGSVCDDDWTKVNARVVCRELGFSRVDVFRYWRPWLTVRRSPYAFRPAKSTDPIWMDDVRCDQNDKSLLNCSFRGWGNNDCSHAEDITIKCSNDVARRCISTGTCSVGFYHSGNMCKRCSGECGSCINKIACTSCRPGTYLLGGACPTSCSFGLYANTNSLRCERCNSNCLTCESNSTFCTSCRKRMYLRDAKCTADCGDQYPIKHVKTLRLVGGKTKFEGRVEVLHRGQWSPICGKTWNKSGGNVVCQQLHYGKAESISKRSTHHAGAHMLAINVRCTGNEGTIHDCRHVDWSYYDCHYNFAAVRCTGPDSSRRCVKRCPIEQGYTIKGKLCHECGFGCKACQNEKPHSCSSCKKGFFRQKEKCVSMCGTGFYFDAESHSCFECDSSCRTCNGPGASNCTDCFQNATSLPAKRFLRNDTCVVSCLDGNQYTLEKPSVATDIRLMDRSNEVDRNRLAGRVEVFDPLTNTFGTVCASSWNWNEATVACRQLGKGAPVNILKGPNSRRYYRKAANPMPVILEGLHCNGNEPTLFDCQQQRAIDIGISTCQQWHEPGVICSENPIQGSTCIDDCGPGYVVTSPTNKTCRKCPATCGDCDTDGKCTSCRDGWFLYRTLCIRVCPHGFYGNTDLQECLQCSDKCDGCFPGRKNDTCKRCNPDAKPELYLHGTTCATTCPDGTKAIGDSFKTSNLTARIDEFDSTVEINWLGQWLPVCFPAWPSKSTASLAKVLCRQLDEGKPVREREGRLLPHTRSVAFVTCQGDEADIGHCLISVGRSWSWCHRFKVECNASLPALEERVCTKVNEGQPCYPGVCDSSTSCYRLTNGSACWECPRSTVGDGKTCKGEIR